MAESRFKRRGDWEQALSDYIVSVEGRAYAYGQHDCMLHAASAVLAMTGVDPAADVRGTYSDKEGAARVLRESYGGTIEKTMDRHLPRIPIGHARRGDLVLHENSIGVVTGKMACFVGQEGDREGLVRIPRGQWEKAWAVE